MGRSDGCHLLAEGEKCPSEIMESLSSLPLLLPYNSSGGIEPGGKGAGHNLCKSDITIGHDKD